MLIFIKMLSSWGLGQAHLEFDMSAKDAGIDLVAIHRVAR